MSFKTLFTDDDAVSPVIGVILMVAITVILAAVIGTFVLGLGENVSQNASAGVSESGANDYTVTLNSLGPSTEGIRCSDDSGVAVTEVGKQLDCSSTGSVTNSVVAFGSNVEDATVYTFD